MIIADVDIFYKGYFSRMPVSKAYNDMEQLRNMGTVKCGDGISDVKLTRIVWIPASHILFSGSPSAAAEFPATMIT